MKDFNWLLAFESDSMRLIALAMGAVALIVVACAKPFSDAWRADRADRRHFEIERMKLLQKLDKKIDEKKQKEGRL